MDKILNAIGQRLAADATLIGLLDSIGGGPAVLRARGFENPRELEGKKPRLVFNVLGSPDVVGLHGYAVDLTVNVDLWGYGVDAWPKADQAAQRTDEVLLALFDVSPGGGTFRWAAVTGWQPVEDSDPLTVRLNNRYSSRYYSDGRLTALTS